MADIKEEIEELSELVTAPEAGVHFVWALDGENDVMVRIPAELLVSILTAVIGAPLTDAGGVAFGDGTELTTDVEKLAFDFANKFLGIGKEAPAAGVHVARNTSSDATPEHAILESSHATPVICLSMQKDDGTIYLRIIGGSNENSIKARTFFRIITNVTNSNGSGGNECFRADAVGNVVIGMALVAGSTAGFAYLPVLAGVPSGGPSQSYTGRRACFLNSSDNKIYNWNGSSWVAAS